MGLRSNGKLGINVAGAVVAVALLAAVAAALRSGDPFPRSFSWSAEQMGPSEFGDLVKSELNPELFRQWAVRQLESAGNGQNRPVPVSQLPPELAALGARGGGIGPQSNVGGSDDQRHMRVFWGFSFGNGYGILIGCTN